MSPQSTDPLNPNSTISFNAGGEKVISTPQPDGSTLVVTMGGGSDGNEKPYTKTEIIPPPQSGVPAPAPVLDYTNKPIQTGQWKNDDGTTTNSLLTRSGTALETTGGGSDANDRPWKVTQEINPLTHSLITSVDTGGKLITDDGFGTITLTENIGNGIHRVTTQHGGLDGAEKPWQDVLVTDGKGNATLSHTVGGITDSTMTNKAGNLVQKTHIDWDGTVSTTAYVGNQPLNTVTTTKNAIGEPTVITTDPSGYVIDSYVIPPEIPATGLLDGFKHSGQVAVDLANNLIWQPIKQNFLPHPFGAPDDTTRSATDWNFPYVPPVKDLRPWPSALDLGLAVLDASVFASLPGLLARGAASLAERVGATLAARAASRNALAAGATTEEAAAASSNAIRDYIISHEAGDTAYSRALADGQDKQTAEALRQQAINDTLAQQQAVRGGLNPLDATPTGGRPTASGLGDRGIGFNEPVPESDPRLLPNDIGVQPNTFGLNSTPLDSLLDAMHKDLGLTWEEGQYRFDQFIANSRAQLDVVLDAILEQEPALADVVSGIKKAETRLGLGGEARGAGGAAGRGDLGTPSGRGGRGRGAGAGTGPNGRGPGGRGPTDPPPPADDLGGEPPADRPKIIYRYNTKEGLWYGYDINENPHALPKGVQPVGENGNRWHGPTRDGRAGFVGKPDWAVVGRSPLRYKGQEYRDLADRVSKATAIPSGQYPHMLRIGENDVEAIPLPGADTLKSQARRFLGEGLDRAQIEVENLDRAKIGQKPRAIVSEQGSIEVEIGDGKTVRINPDFIVYDPETKTIQIIDSKFGKGAVYTDNQLDAYPILAQGRLKLSELKLSQSVMDSLEERGIDLNTRISGVETHPWNTRVMPDPEVLARATADFAASADALEAAGGELGESASQAMAFLKTWNQEVNGGSPGNISLGTPIGQTNNQLGSIALPILSGLNPMMPEQQSKDRRTWITDMVGTGTFGPISIAPALLQIVPSSLVIEPTASRHDIDQSLMMVISVPSSERSEDADTRRSRGYLPLGRRL